LLLFFEEAEDFWLIGVVVFAMMAAALIA